MVVDDRDFVDGLEQRFALDIARTVDVHDDEKRVEVAHDHGVLGADEHALVLALGFEAVDELGRHGVLPVNHDVHRLVLDARRADHAGRRADGIHVAVLVAHDEHLRGVADQLAERVRDHAALDLGALFDFLAQAAEELEVVAVLDDRLIAAARERHVDGESRELIALRECLAVAADADGERRDNALMVLNIAHFLKNRELSCRELVQLGVLDDEDILVAVVLAHDGARVLDPGGQALVDAGEDVGLFRVGRVLDQLLVVVDGDDRDGRPAGRSVIAQMHEFGAINKMQHHHLSRARLHHAAEYVIDAAPHAQLARKGGLALDEPAGFKRRRKLAQTHMRRVRKVAGHIRERLVRPDNLSGRCERHDGRKRRFRDRRTDLAALDLDVLHQLVHLLPPLRVAADRDKAQNYDGRHADQSVRSGKIQTDGRKCEKQHIKHRAAGSKRRLDFLFQIPAPLFGRKYTA